MIFIVIVASMMLIWSILGQRKILSASFANLLGTALFVVLGLQFERNIDAWIVISIGIGFYLFLAIGEYCARHVPLNTNRYKQVGQLLISHPIANYALLIIFIVFCFLPLFQVLTSGQSIRDVFASVWLTNTAPLTSRDLIEISSQSLFGREALIKGVQTQLSGFWYLSLGVLIIKKRSLFFPVFAIYLLGSFLTSGGFRSLLMVSLLLPVLLVLMSHETRGAKRVNGPGRTGAVRSVRFLSMNKPTRSKLTNGSKRHGAIRPLKVLLIGVMIVGLLLFLDWLRYGRQGLVSEGTIFDRLERTLRTDFAYGGFGLQFGINNRPESMDRGIDYIKRTIVLPIPRVLWPEKPTSNPNQEYTELVTGRSYSEFGSILLFTPLGEALFHFGYLGIALIPFFYGFLVIILERIYSSSEAFKGLLVQAYIWAFLAMRLTFFNLYSTLVITNFVLILLLAVGARLISKQGIPRPKVVQHEAS
jgi:hypothetical protein